MDLCLTVAPNWETTLKVIEAVVSILTLLATIVGLALAYFGYQSWRGQVVGKTAHDVARAVLLSTLKVRAEIRKIRRNSLLPPPDELDPQAWYSQVDDEDPDPDDPMVPYVRGIKNFYGAGLVRLRDEATALEFAKLEASVLWGENAEGDIPKLIKLATDFDSTLWAYAMVRGYEAMTESSPAPASPVLRQQWAIVAAPSIGDDAFGEEVDALVSKIERYYREKLRLVGIR